MLWQLEPLAVAVSESSSCCEVLTACDLPHPEMQYAHLDLHIVLRRQIMSGEAMKETKMAMITFPIPNPSAEQRMPLEHDVAGLNHLNEIQKLIILIKSFIPRKS